MLAIDFETQSKVSLAAYADVLRVLDEQPVPIRDLPRRSGVSKEAISMALGVLSKRDLVMVEPNSNDVPGKAARLTTKGTRSRSAHQRLLQSVEADWESRYGADVINALRNPLEQLTGDAHGSLLFPALQAHPDGWRAAFRAPELLPHFPMVLHRGGFPDGS